MKKWAIIVILVASTVRSHGAVVISDDFTIGTNDNVHQAFVSGTTTDVGNVVWGGTGNFRMITAGDITGQVVSQNNIVGGSPRVYLDYAPIMDAGNVTTLSLTALVADCLQMNFGFSSTNEAMSADILGSSVFWTRINSNGTVDMWVHGNGANTKILNGVNVKATGDDLLSISLSYDADNNQVWGSVIGGAATATLAPTTLSFTPNFDQFNFELQLEGGTRTYEGHFDDVVVDSVMSSSPSAYESWATSFGLTTSPHADPSYDYDNDGLLNIYEYGLGGNPTNEFDQGISPGFGIENVGGTNYFGYVYPQLSDPASGLTYSLALRTDLIFGDWATNTGYVVTGTNITGGLLDFVTNVTDTVDSTKYIRLIIE